MISWAITACNEHVELKRLLDQIESIKKDTDEIVILLDTTFTPEVKEIAMDYNPWITPLKGDFASFKNTLKDHCTQPNIVFLDADELLSDTLALTIHFLLEFNPTVDCWGLPRINTVEGIKTRPDLIQQWGWNVDEKGWINFPDTQLRICKNLPEIKWKGNVHERLDGYKNLALLEGEEWALLHPKSLEKQIKQNELYSTL